MSLTPADTATPTSKPTSRWLGLGVAGFAVASLTGFLVWEHVLKDDFVAKRFGVVVPGVLYRSGQISDAMLEPTVREHNIAAIIDLNGIEPDLPGQSAEIEMAQEMKLDHYRFQLGGDGTGDIARYADAIETIAKCRTEGKPVLVHCAAGSQRTGGVVASYRVLVLKEDPKNAVAEMARYDWDPVEDVDLLAFVNGHMPQLAEMLVERGVIDEVPNPLPLLPTP